MNQFVDRVFKKKKNGVKLRLHGMEGIQFTAVEFSLDDIEETIEFGKEPHLSFWGIFENAKDENQKYMAFFDQDSNICICYRVQ